MKTLLIYLTYLRAILHWIWIAGLTMSIGFVAITTELLGLRHYITYMNQIWARALLRFAGIHVQTKNQHLLPTTSCVLIFNHKSYVDILALLQTAPRRIYFGAKKGLFSVPIFGFIMKHTGHFPIEWQNPRAVYRQYMALNKRVKRGDIFALAPEGGRTNLSTIAHFKKGPFIMAQHYHLPIVPVVIYGAEKTMPIGSKFFNIGKWLRKVHIEYLPPMDTINIEKQDISKLRNQAHQAMSKVFSQYQR